MLIEVEPDVSGMAPVRRPVDKTFRRHLQHQPMLMPPDLRGWVAADHPARRVEALLDRWLVPLVLVVAALGVWRSGPRAGSWGRR